MLISRYLCYRLLFFFQAEDGIRDATVTGVQTCALPISGSFCIAFARFRSFRGGCPPPKTWHHLTYETFLTEVPLGPAWKVSLPEVTRKGCPFGSQRPRGKLLP